jgi:hypothetical protein
MADALLLWILIPTGQRASGEWIDDTLKLRAAEAGLSAKLPLAGNFPRQRVEAVRDPDPTAAVNALFYQRGWTDGLPVVPPTVDRVEGMVHSAGLDRNAVLGEMQPLGGLATVERLAANAVMAGCTDAHFPVVMAIVEALLEPAFNLRGVQTTDENVAPLAIFSGLAAHRLEINAGTGALGPGWRGNAAIGRAIRLIMNNIGGGWPGAVSLAGLGHPGRYSLCFAEREAESPWDPLRVDLGLSHAEQAVVVYRAETIVNVTGGLEEIASVMGSAASYFTMLYSGKVAVALSPYVARNLADQGWTKQAVQDFLHREGRLRTEVWERSWIRRTIRPPNEWPAWVQTAAATGSIPAVEDPADISVVVAGANLPIPQNAYFPSWGFPACRIVKAVRFPASQMD